MAIGYEVLGWITGPQMSWSFGGHRSTVTLGWLVVLPCAAYRGERLSVIYLI